MEENKNSPSIDQPYLKLTKNRNGFTWDIKIMGLDVSELKRLNDEMEKTFSTALIVGSKNGIDE